MAYSDPMTRVRGLAFTDADGIMALEISGPKSGTVSIRVQTKSRALSRKHAHSQSLDLAQRIQ